MSAIRDEKGRFVSPVDKYGKTLRVGDRVCAFSDELSCQVLGTITEIFSWGSYRVQLDSEVWIGPESVYRYPNKSEIEAAGWEARE